MSDNESSSDGEDIIPVRTGTTVARNPIFPPYAPVSRGPSQLIQQPFRYENPSTINRISTRIGSILRRQMTSEEIRDLRAYINRLDQKRLDELPTAQAEESIIKNWLKSFRQLYTEDEEIDLREINRQSMGLTSESDSLSTRLVADASNGSSINVNLSAVSGLYKKDDIRQFLNPEAPMLHTQALLDSRWRRLDIGGTASFGWLYNNLSAQIQGCFSVLDDVKNVHSIQIMPFRIPYPKSTPNASGADNKYKMITLLIQEFANQSVIGHEGRNYHFAFQPTMDGDFIQLDPYNYRKGKFIFNKPITQLDTLTLTFGSPLQPIVFDNDRQIVTISASNPAVVTAPQDHYLSTGDIVYFGSFASGNIAADSAIMLQINASAGLEIIKLSSTTFSIPVDASTMTVGGSTTCYYGSKRMFIPFEVKYNPGYAPI